MNKRAQYVPGKQVPYFIIALFVIAFMFIGLIVLFSKFVSRPIITDDQIYVTIYKQRFLDSPECFSYKDLETGNVYPSTIDKSKFTNERLNNCYMENKDSQFEFHLVLDDGKEKLQAETANFKVFGNQITVISRVLVFDKNELKPGKLSIRIQGVQSE